MWIKFETCFKHFFIRGTVFMVVGYGSQIIDCYGRLIPPNVYNPIVLINRHSKGSLIKEGLFYFLWS